MLRETAPFVMSCFVFKGFVLDSSEFLESGKRLVVIRNRQAHTANEIVLNSSLT